jgi:hypothetical protein
MNPTMFWIHNSCIWTSIKKLSETNLKPITNDFNDALHAQFGSHLNFVCGVLMIENKIAIWFLIIILAITFSSQLQMDNITSSFSYLNFKKNPMLYWGFNWDHVYYSNIFVLGWKSFKVYHTWWKGPSFYCNFCLFYILISIENNELKFVKIFKRIILYHYNFRFHHNHP